jgi:DNA-binding CsgD family transcriptional regulator
VFDSSLEELITKHQLREEIYFTSREIDVMRWTADDKNPHEVSIILIISERTVNFHLNKLGANNRIFPQLQPLRYGFI